MPNEKRAQVIYMKETLGMNFREISSALNIGYDNTRKIHRIFKKENRVDRKKIFDVDMTPNLQGNDETSSE